MYPAEEINAGGKSFNKNFVWMQLQAQHAPQEILRNRQYNFQQGSVMRDNHEIIGVADVALRLKPVFHELVKFIHVYVDE